MYDAVSPFTPSNVGAAAQIVVPGFMTETSFLKVQLWFNASPWGLLTIEVSSPVNFGFSLSMIEIDFSPLELVLMLLRFEVSFVSVIKLTSPSFKPASKYFIPALQLIMFNCWCEMIGSMKVLFEFCECLKQPSPKF